MSRMLMVIGLAAVLGTGGCMVGPNYKPPKAPLAEEYANPDSPNVKRGATDVDQWWAVFNDAALTQFVQVAYRQSPTVQIAAVRVLEAQAAKGIAVGLLFPQDQAALGGYTRTVLSQNVANYNPGADRRFDNWQLGAAASWELDVWGRYRRGIESANAEVLASVATYDDVLVSLLGDVASEYIRIRMFQERLAVTKANVELQKSGLEVAENKFKGGTATDLDRTQALSLLRDTESTIPEIEATIRQGQNRLCVLLGIPPKSLPSIGVANPQIPVSPPTVAVGIPADLLRRRPDVRRVERNLAAQSARIGIAKADLYPSLTLVGDFRVASQDFGGMFDHRGMQAFGGPTFRWNLLNYGRIENNVRVEDARFQELIGVYENTVLNAQAEVENAVAGFLAAQRQVVLLSESVTAAKRAVDVAQTQYRGGIADYTRVLNTQQSLQAEQDRLVTVRGAVALNLVSVYRSLGGGWSIRGDRIEIAPATREQMRQRTNWGNLIPPGGMKASASPSTQPEQ